MPASAHKKPPKRLGLSDGRVDLRLILAGDLKATMVGKVGIIDTEDPRRP